MFKATLIYKNGNKVTVKIPFMLQFIDFAPINCISSGIEEFTALTPDNIINEGGFTEVSPLETNMVMFELTQVGLHNIGDLIYEEI